jgi:putative hemolysin
MIRVMENATGRLGLIRRAEGYGDEVRQGRDFWQVMVERYGLSLDVVGGSLDNIPREGPLILIANHPYGILDGLMLGHILSQARGDFRILAHACSARPRISTASSCRSASTTPRRRWR